MMKKVPRKFEHKKQAYIRRMLLEKGIEMTRAWKRDIDKYQKDARDEKSDDEKPDPVNDTLFLYIRATEDDRGERPIVPPWWISPDLNVLTADGIERTQLEAGQTYTIECVVWNGGGWAVPSATVDFFLCTPSLGRYVSVSALLGVHSVSIPAAQSDAIHGHNRVSFQWRAGSVHAGHRCLMGRVYSFSPIDLPNDFEHLDPPTDRHVAQQNLNIVEQSSATLFDFDVFTSKAFDTKEHQFRMEIQPVEKIPEFLKCTKGIRHLEIKPLPPKTNFEIKSRKDTLNLDSEVDLQQISGSTWKGHIHGVGYAPLTLEIPDFKLYSKKAYSFQITLLEAKEKVTGGITLIVYSK